MNNHATVQSSTPVSPPLLQVSGALHRHYCLILAAAWLVKRLGFAPKRTGVNGLKISASASLGARERVVVVDVEDAAGARRYCRANNLLYKLPPFCTNGRDTADRFSVGHENLLLQREILMPSFVVCRTCPSLAVTPSPSRNCRVSPAKCCLQWWTKLVAPGANAGVHHLVDVYSGNFTDDDQFHPHHHCFWFIA